MAHRILLTGCARASTGYHAQLLSRVGVPCGHEVLFDPETTAAGCAPAWPAEIAAESSWLAAPFIAALPRGTLVVHLVRAPRLALASLWRIALFRSSRSPYRSFAERHCSPLASGSPLERTARYWLHWNRWIESSCERAEVSYLRIRAGETDESVLRQIFALAERPLAAGAADVALAAIPDSFNTAGDRTRDASVDWSPLAGSALESELALLAERYELPPPRFAVPPAA